MKWLKITLFQTLKSFRTQQTHANTCALLLGDTWKFKTICSKIDSQYQTCLISSEWSVPIIDYTFFCEICQFWLPEISRLALTFASYRLLQTANCGQKSEKFASCIPAFSFNSVFGLERMFWALKVTCKVCFHSTLNTFISEDQGNSDFLRSDRFHLNIQLKKAAKRETRRE